MVNRYPHKIQINYNSAGAIANGIFVPGTSFSVEIECNIQRRNPFYKTRLEQDEVLSQWLIMCPCFSESDSILPSSVIVPLIAPSNFLETKLISCVPFQKHVEIEC